MVFQVKKYKLEWRSYIDELKKYKDAKAKTFIIVMGQCSLMMKNKVESHKDFEDIQDRDDIKELMKIIKDFSYSTTDARYEHWNMVFAIGRVLKISQRPKESLHSWYSQPTTITRWHCTS